MGQIFGVNEDGYILKNENGELYEVVDLDVYFKRKYPEYVKIDIEGNKIKYSTVRK